MGLRVVLFEDQPLLRDALAAALAARGHKITASYGAVADAKAAGSAVAQSDVVLVDIRLADAASFELVESLKRDFPDKPLVWLTSADEEYLLRRAFELNLPGFVHKEDSLPTLVHAIEEVAAGRSFQSEVVQRFRRQLGGMTQSYEKMLSRREQEVLKLVACGLSHEECGAILGLSAGTVHAHRRNIMSRLGLHNAAEIQAYALKVGFITSDDLRLSRSP